MKLIKRIFVLLIVASLLLATVPNVYAASYTYDADAALSYAKSHWNDGVGQCAEFVRKCMNAGGCPITSNGCSSMVRQEILNSSSVCSKYGTWEKLTVESNGYIKASKNVGKVSPGDPIFLYCPKEADKNYYVHVVLCSSVDADGYLHCYAHNRDKNDELFYTKYCGYCEANTVSAVYAFHMNSKSTPAVTVKEYFDCNVQINTTAGKTVNLYKNIGDATRYTYFSKGQTAYSTRGAKTSDGATWYQIQAIDGNDEVVTLWLNAGSSGVTVINKETVKDSITFSPSSLTLAPGGSQTVSIQFQSGNLKYLAYGCSNDEICTASWGKTDWKKGTSSLQITGKDPGTATVTVYFLDENENKYYSKSFTVTVNAPTYTVSYNANGGSGAPASQTKQYNKTLTLSTKEPTRSGYTFQGWATTPSGSVQYRPGGAYTNNANATLYAVWKKAGFTVTYYIYGLGGPYENETGTADDPVVIADGESRDDYVFQGWSTSPEGSVQYRTGDVYQGPSDLTLYPIYERGTYTLIYDANGGSGAPASQTGQWGVALTLSTEIPTRSGYTFQGWANLPTINHAYWQPGDTIFLHNVTSQTIYAVWKKNDASVPVSSITLNRTALTLEEGETAELEAAVSPSNATDQAVTWTSSDPSVVRVSGSGGVSAVAAGTATVTAEAGGKSAACTVTVVRKSAAGTPRISVDGGTAGPGQTVTVRISLDNNPGIVNMSLNVRYDRNVMSLISVTDSGVLNGAMHSDNLSLYPYQLSWSDDVAESNMMGDGTVVTLTFAVKDSAPEGSYPVTVSYEDIADAIYDVEFHQVDFAIENGTVTVSQSLPGDINGDGRVTNIDRTVLARFLAKWNGYDEATVDQSAADVNQDGKVTNIDRTVLARYLAKWAGYETLPHV